MPPTVLIAATEARWFGPARLPRWLHRAGFEVALLAPRGTLAEKSSHVARTGHVPRNATAIQWMQALAAMVKAVAPRLVLPGDDTAVRLLDLLVNAPPEGLRTDVHAELSALVRRSLGDPAGYRPSVDKTLLPQLAAKLGVRMPPSIVTADAGAAMLFASAHGFPVVLKRPFTSAGNGVVVCADPGALRDAFPALQHAPRGALDEAHGSLLVQAFVPGPVRNYAAAAWQGQLLTGYASEKILGNPDTTGPSTVTRHFRDDTLREITARLVRGIGISGFLSPGFVIEEGTGTPHLLEINRRMVAAVHRGCAFGVDHCAALRAMLEGTPIPTRDTLAPDEEHATVNFPQEWLRDPRSPWLRSHPVDAPWDEPELLEAMLAMRLED